MFEEAVEELKKTEKSKILPNAGKLEAEIKGQQAEKNKLLDKNKSCNKKIKEYDIVKGNLARILSDEPEKIFESKHREQEQQQKNNDDIQI